MAAFNNLPAELQLAFVEKYVDVPALDIFHECCTNWYIMGTGLAHHSDLWVPALSHRFVPTDNA
eukprot:5221466-Karenia_brevis.AAC.1